MPIFNAQLDIHLYALFILTSNYIPHASPANTHLHVANKPSPPFFVNPTHTRT